jgi:nucleoid DNA-binding protein
MINKQKDKSYLDASVARELGIPIVHVEKITAQMFKEIEKAVAENGRIELRNFSVLRVVNIPAQQRRNPKTQESFLADEYKTVRFDVGKRFKEVVSK